MAVLMSLIALSTISRLDGSYSLLIVDVLEELEPDVCILSASAAERYKIKNISSEWIIHSRE